MQQKLYHQYISVRTLGMTTCVQKRPVLGKTLYSYFVLKKNLNRLKINSGGGRKICTEFFR